VSFDDNSQVLKLHREMLTICVCDVIHIIGFPQHES